MLQPGSVLDIAPMGVRVEIRRTGAETDGELLEFDVTGRARGLVAQTHVHTRQEERLEVVEGAMDLTIRGRRHRLQAGEAMVVPPGAPHRQQPAGVGDGRVRIQVRPAGDTDRFLSRLAELAATGRLVGGFPRPVAAAELLRDFGDSGHAAQPPLPVQRAFARSVLAVASREFAFTDEWDVAAPAEAVFAALADGRTYPRWWRPVFLEVRAPGPPAVGQVVEHHFKSRLPYHLRTRLRIVELDPPRRMTADVVGDLSGRGSWTLTPTASGVHVRLDWHVLAERPLLRVLTPVLRPALRRNHAWAVARAGEGLEPYARATVAETRVR